jgi:hypothetical protein
MLFNFYQSVLLRLECSARLFVWIQTLESTPKERRFISFLRNWAGFTNLGESIHLYSLYVLCVDPKKTNVLLSMTIVVSV